ncbi:retrotransposon protein, putative, ty1-copia subclass [Tanacetum coccineum]
MYVIEQLLPAAPAADSPAQVLSQWNAVYDAYNEVACLILGSMTPKLHRQFENSSPYDIIKELKSMFEKQAGVERFNLIQTFHACKQKEGLILNGVTKDFLGFVRNYNMHNMGKTIGELHAMLIEYEKGLPKKAETPQDKQVYIPKPKNPTPSAKEHPTKDDTCHHCKEVGHWKRNCPVYLAELLKKKKQVGSASSSDKLSITSPFITRGVVSVHRLVENGFIYDESYNSAIILLRLCSRVYNTHSQYGPTKKVDKTPYELWYGKVPNLSYLKDTQRKQWVTIFYFPSENKIVVARYAKFFEKNLITQEVSGRAIDLEEIQDEDTSPSEITSEIPMKVEEAEEHNLGDLNEPTSYKSAMKDYENQKVDRCYVIAENTSMMDNMVWVLVDLPPSCKTIGSKWIFKKNIDMDAIVHTYKACLVANGYTQLYEVDYEETFSPVADIRAIMILISIAAFYDYEIWQIDVKTAFLNGYLDKDIYMVQSEGFVDPNHPRKLCKLQRSIYGLKQASRSWNKRFDEEIKRDGSKRLIGLGQNAYIDKILKRYKMDNSKRGHIPMQERLVLYKIQGASTPKEVKRMQNVHYDSAMSSIMYAVRCTRPNVAFAQKNNKPVFQQNPGELHWTVVKNILKYLRNTKDMFLVYGGNSEAEMEAVWIRKFISGLGIVPTINEPIRMFCDNSAALHFANEPGVQMGTRHYHRSNLLKVHTYDNLADPFTKALPKGKLTQHARSMGLRLASSFM